MGKKEIRFIHDFYGVVTELEAVLCIDGVDYSTRDVNVSIVRIKDRLQRQYSIDLTNVEEAYSAMIIGDEIRGFLDNVQYTYNRICGCSHYFRYSREIPVNLKSINYLGFTKDAMLGILKDLQQEGKQQALEYYMEQIKVKIGSISMCVEKKLYMILYLSYYLKLYELTAIIAEILYIGGI